MIMACCRKRLPFLNFDNAKSLSFCTTTAPVQYWRPDRERGRYRRRRCTRIAHKNALLFCCSPLRALLRGAPRSMCMPLRKKAFAAGTRFRVYADRDLGGLNGVNVTSIHRFSSRISIYCGSWKNSPGAKIRPSSLQRNPPPRPFSIFSSRTERISSTGKASRNAALPGGRRPTTWRFCGLAMRWIKSWPIRHGVQPATSLGRPGFVTSRDPVTSARIRIMRRLLGSQENEATGRGVGKESRCTPGDHGVPQETLSNAAAVAKGSATAP